MKELSKKLNKMVTVVEEMDERGKRKGKEERQSD